MPTITELAAAMHEARAAVHEARRTLHRCTAEEERASQVLGAALCLFSVGDRVWHPQYGAAYVAHIDGSYGFPGWDMRLFIEKKDGTPGKIAQHAYDITAYVAAPKPGGGV